MKKYFKFLFFISPILLLAACASVVNGKKQDISINYNTDGVKVKVFDNNGTVVYDNISPYSIELERGKGYFKGRSYSIEASKEGYQTQTYSLKPEISNWYFFGNIVIGGLIGWVVVDPLTGGMYRLSPETLNINLKK